MRRFLSVWLPHWPLESRQRARSKRHKAERSQKPPKRTPELAVDLTTHIPFALVQAGARGIEVTAVNRAAQIAGISEGTSLVDARALAANLATEEATPDVDMTQLHSLALWCLRYSPLVTTRGSDDIFIDITGCAHLFGGEDALMTRIQASLRHFDITSRIGLADTIGAAWAAAHYGQKALTCIQPDEQQSFLSPLPISALRLERGTLKRLSQLGLRQIGMLQDMPTAPLTKRFGPMLRKRLHQATGAEIEIFDPLFPLPEYSLRHPFIEPVLYLDGISIALEELTEKLTHLLDQDKKSARRLQLNLFRLDGHTEQISVSTSRPCYEKNHILLLFRERLAHLSEKMDAGFGYDLMSLAAFDLELRQDTQSTWNENENNNQESLGRLLDRFGNRFGFDHISYWENTESYIPERASHKISAQTKTPSRPSPSSPQGRPLLLLPRAMPITVLAEVPDGPPIRFSWHRQQHTVIAAQGPERIAPEWWQDVSHGTPQTRDYYCVENKGGYRFWIFRDGLYERANDIPRWFIHGFFA